MKCRVPGCSRESKVRGLCMPCYSGVREAVLMKRTTWKELEDTGVIAPKKYKSGPLHDFLKEKIYDKIEKIT